MSTLLQDLRYGARMLLKKPGFAVIAVITLGLGIGANTAIFSVVNAALLRASPYHNAERLILLTETTSRGGRDFLSIQELQTFQSETRALEDLTGMTSQSVNLTGGDRPDRVRGAYVLSNFFQVFNIKLVIGRSFAPTEDRQGAEKVVVIKENL